MTYSQLKSSEAACHEACDQFVETHINKVMAHYKERIKTQNCTNPNDVKLSKKKLVDLCEELYGKVTEFGSQKPGQRLADMGETAPKPAPIT